MDYRAYIRSKIYHRLKDKDDFDFKLIDHIRCCVQSFWHKIMSAVYKKHGNLGEAYFIDALMYVWIAHNFRHKIHEGFEGDLIIKWKEIKKYGCLIKLIKRGLLPIKLNGNWCLIDRKGNIILALSKRS